MRCNEAKAEVEAGIEDYKEKVHHARSIEKQLQVFHINIQCLLQIGLNV